MLASLFASGFAVLIVGATVLVECSVVVGSGFPSGPTARRDVLVMSFGGGVTSTTLVEGVGVVVDFDLVDVELLLDEVFASAATADGVIVTVVVTVLA